MGFGSDPDTGPGNHKSLRWISAGYPPEEIRFVANESLAPFLGNDRYPFPRCSVRISLTGRGGRSTLIGHKLDLIRLISSGHLGREIINPSGVNVRLSQAFGKKEFKSKSMKTRFRLRKK